MITRSVLFSHPLGAPFATQALCALAENRLLSEIVTALHISHSTISRLRHLSGGSCIANELSRRAWVPLELEVHCTCYPMRELLRLFLLKSGISQVLGLNAHDLASRVYESLDRVVAERHLEGSSCDTLYAYEDGAATSFERAKALGKLCIYDLPIVHYQTAARIQKEEQELFPELAASLQAAHEPRRKIERKDKELALADRVIVPSRFVYNSLIDTGVSPAKIGIVPYGSPVYFTARAHAPKKFRVLFVGRIGPRKGVHYLLKAWNNLRLPDAELLLVGINEFPPAFLNRYQNDPTITIAPSKPHHLLESCYQQASVLVLPSLAEGFPLVLLEAMRCGVPVIASSHCGAEDLIEQGIQGFVVKARDQDALEQAIELLYRERERAAEMGRAAFRRALDFSWDRYREGIKKILIGDRADA